MGMPRYYGWRIIFTLAITETISYGIIYYAFSVMLAPMAADTGWSRAELTGGFSLALLVTGAMAFPIGSWVDKHGTRALMTAGSIGASILVILWSQVTTLPAFYLVWIGLGVCGAMVFYEPAFAAAATWFTRQRAKALATITFAAGLASTIFVPLSDLLMRTYGWRDATLILGILLAATTILPHAVILRRRPQDLGLFPDGDAHDTRVVHAKAAQPDATLRHALHSRVFWLMTFAFAVAGFSASAIRVHFIPYLTDSGIDSSTAAAASGAIGLMQVLGRVIFAPLDSRLPSRIIAAGIFSMQAAAMMVLFLGVTPLVIVIFVVVFGTAYGAQTLARPSMIAETFGSAHYGRISSVLSIFTTITGTVAPLVAALSFDITGSYDLLLILIVGLAVLSTGVMLYARAPQVDLTRAAASPSQSTS
ncbi:MAG: MFS transporter [Pleurocapsa minor GSE-CHR-MK-17-07R]|nr:MFS transporter [Pleurocapsa minor GSE-CHR-MK 17-07R]